MKVFAALSLVAFAAACLAGIYPADPTDASQYPPTGATYHTFIDGISQE